MFQDHATVLRTHNSKGIGRALAKDHTTSIEYARILRMAVKTDPAELPAALAAEQGIALMTRSGMVNSHMSHGGIDTTRADELVAQGKLQILAARNRAEGGDFRGACASLDEFYCTLAALRDAYCGIQAGADLSDANAQGVLSIARSLDVTMAQIRGL